MSQGQSVDYYTQLLHSSQLVSCFVIFPEAVTDVDVRTKN